MQDSNRPRQAPSAAGALSAREAAEALSISTRTIRRAIKRGDIQATKFAGVYRISPAELARYRRALTVAHVGDHAATPLLRLAPTVPPPRLSPPAQLTSFIGRENLIARVVSSLRQPDLRLLTLTGPGGVGKTRLAIRVMTDVNADFQDGAAFVSLASLVEPRLVMSTILMNLGHSIEDNRDPLDRLKSFLSTKRFLLILDNIEQVADAALEIADLLRACPRLTVLATSRVPLRISGERQVSVRPMSLPGGSSGALIEQARAFEAVRLFVERTQAILPDFTLTPKNVAAIVEICRRLDGLPLAIELAAVHGKILSPPALLARLDRRLPLLKGGPEDRPARLQTMHNAIAWSYDLLPESEQRLFRQISVFSGGFTLEAAEAVARSEERVAQRRPSPPNHLSRCAGEIESESRFSVLDLLASLVDKSLLQQAPGPQGEPRFNMFETVREYGLEQLEEHGGPAAVHAAHAAYFLAMAERGERVFAGTVAGNRHDVLAPEVDNIRAAQSWFSGHGATEEALRLATAAYPLWRVAGDTAGVCRALRSYLKRADDIAPVVRTKALNLTAMLEAAGGNCPSGMAFADEALAIARERGDDSGEAQALATLGMINFFLGRVEDGFRYTEEAIGHYRTLDDRHALGNALCQLAMGGNLGAYEGAGGPAALDRTTAATEEALSLFRDLNQPADIARAHCGLGYLAFMRQDYSRAAVQLRESIALFWQLHEVWSLPAPIEHLAAIAALTGHPVPAARFYGTIDVLRESIGRPVPPAFQAVRARERGVCRASLGGDVFAAAHAEGDGLPLEIAIAEALALAASIEDETGGKHLAMDPTTGSSLLSPREIDVLRLVAAGLTNRQIADELFLSPATIKRHVSNILTKLGLASRTAATNYAVQIGLADTVSAAGERPLPRR